MPGVYTYFSAPDCTVPWVPYELPTNDRVMFDSGGLGKQQSFSFTFSIPGTYPYHSSTEPLYVDDYRSCGCSVVTYEVFGTIIVKL